MMLNTTTQLAALKAANGVLDQGLYAISAYSSMKSIFYFFLCIVCAVIEQARVSQLVSERRAATAALREKYQQIQDFEQLTV